MDRTNRACVTRRALMKASGAAAVAAAFAVPASMSRLRAIAAADPPATPAAADPDRAALFAELGAFVERRMAELKVPGVAVGIVDGGREHAAGFGVTNLDHPLPVGVDTLFQIGSTTKTVTATAVMRLAEQGALDIEAPVRTYLPGFRVADPATSEAVRVRHLLTHSAGWYGDDFTDPGDGDDALARYVAEMADLPQLFPAGEFFSYNNAAVDLLGRVIEVATGQTYEAAARDLVLAPLGMDDSFFFAEEVITEAVAAGHAGPPEDPAGQPAVVTPWAIPRASNPAGGVVSSLADQLRYARFHLGDGAWEGERLLRPETMRRMQSPLGPGGGSLDSTTPLDGVGALWLLSTIGGARVVAHGGSTNGQQAAFALVPERGFGVTVLTNADAGAALGADVVGRAFDRFLGLRPVAPTPLAAPAETLVDFAGTFDLGDGERLRVAAGDGGLTAAAMGLELALAWVGDDRFLTDLLGLRILVDFERDATERVGWVRLGGRLAPRAG